MNLGYFKLTVFLTEKDFTLQVFAGRDRDEVDDKDARFRLPLGPQKDIVREVLLKLETALRNSQRGIDLKVKGKEINRDPAFPLPAAPIPGVIEIEIADVSLTSRRVDPIVPLPDVKPPVPAAPVRKPDVVKPEPKPKPKRKQKPKEKTSDDKAAAKTDKKPGKPKPEPEPKPEDVSAPKGRGRQKTPESSTEEPKTKTTGAKRPASTRKPKPKSGA